MRTSLLSLLVVASLGFLPACATTGPKVVVPVSATTNAEFDTLKSLAGEWTMKDEKGNDMLASVFTVSSNGSVVREVMFPGAPSEMTNMYHLDGDSIVMTHYCAMGNQPRMRCTNPKGNTFEFVGYDCTNLTSSDIEYMASMTLTIDDPNHVHQNWSSMKKGATTSHADFELTRRK
jgi:hypothetical protein